MIGLVFKMFGFGGADGLCAISFGAILALLATCGMYRLLQCHARECHCIKRCMRAIGNDRFDDFEATIIVHEAVYTASTRLNTKVRITAGSHTVATDESSKGVFQQPVMVFVQQGTEAVTVELLSTSDKKVLATKRLDVLKDILDIGAREAETLYPMKQKSKTILNPKIRLTILREDRNDMEKGLLASMKASPEAGVVLLQQLHKKQADEARRGGSVVVRRGDGGGGGSGAGGNPIVAGAADAAKEVSELELLLGVCTGPVEKYGSWGSRTAMYLGAQGPPTRKKYTLGMWPSQADYETGQRPQEEVDILKIVSVGPDPHPQRQEVFLVQYVDASHVRQRLTLRRKDRARDVWVEMLQGLIKKVHSLKNEKKKSHEKKLGTQLSTGSAQAGHGAHH